jgi:opacity protein-like surface antigen
MAASASAQKHELAIVAGGHFPVNADFNVDPGFAIQGDYAFRVANAHVAALYLDIPLAFGLKNDGLLPSVSGIEQRKFSSWFFAPGVKLKLAPAFPVSPYFTLGVGVAHFNLDATSTSPSDSINKAVVQFGGGFDMKVAPFVSLRAEVRDYYSGNPFRDVGTGTFTSGQHDILPMGGIVFRF